MYLLTHVRDRLRDSGRQFARRRLIRWLRPLSRQLLAALFAELLINLGPKTRLLHGRLIHTRSSAAFITTTFEFRFSVHRSVPEGAPNCDSYGEPHQSIPDTERKSSSRIWQANSLPFLRSISCRLPKIVFRHLHGKTILRKYGRIDSAVRAITISSGILGIPDELSAQTIAPF